MTACKLFNTSITFITFVVLTTFVAVSAAFAATLPNVGSANLTGHFDASDINNDSGATNPGDGGNVLTWTDLVSGSNLNRDGGGGFPIYVANGINGQPVVRMSAVSGDQDILFNNGLNVSARTVFAVMTMGDNGVSLSTAISDASHNRNIRQSTSSVPAYFSGNGGDFVQTNVTGTLYINGNDTLVIPGGYNAPHVVKAVRSSTNATFGGLRFGDNITATRRWEGDIAEVIFYDNQLSGNDTAAVNRYLMEKYDVTQVVDERITDTSQIATKPFGEARQIPIGVNFHYGATVNTDFMGIGFDNIDLRGGAPPSGPFLLSANQNLTGATLTLDMPFTGDNTPRSQGISLGGADASTINTVAGQMFYMSNPASSVAHETANMTFANLFPNVDIFVQVLGGDAGWNGDLQVVANGETIDWLSVADGNGSTASLLGFFTQSDSNGELALEFTVPTGNFAGIGGIILTQQAPEPSTWMLALLGCMAVSGLLYRKRKNRIGVS